MGASRPGEIRRSFPPPALPLRNRSEAARWFVDHIEPRPVPALAADGSTTASADYLTLVGWWDHHGELPSLEQD